MNRQTIQDHLHKNHLSFISYLGELTNEAFLKSKNEKWTAGQQLEHIYRSVKPLRQVLGQPKFILKLIWGVANRESKNYDELVGKYLLKLSNGGRATGRFIPNAVDIPKGMKLKEALREEVVKLTAILEKFTEDQLDKFVLPHPLLGKLTIREMMYFTIYHVGHHQQLIKRDVK
jgi:hypothetical protein